MHNVNTKSNKKALDTLPKHTAKTHTHPNMHPKDKLLPTEHS